MVRRPPARSLPPPFAALSRRVKADRCGGGYANACRRMRSHRLASIRIIITVYIYSYFSSHQPAYKLIEGYVGYGEKDARQHVGYAQALLPEPEEVYGQAEQEHPAHGGHFRHNGLGEVRR